MAIMVAALAAVVGGCAERRPDVWIPQPPVLWEDVSVNPIEHTRDGYLMLSHAPTQGLFPAALGVSRVDLTPDALFTTGLRPVLKTNPRNEYLQWHSALDDQMAISEVFPLRDKDLGGRDLTPGLLLDAFLALDARLGLVYAVNEPRENETEIFGVLYDTETARPIAALHKSAVSVPEDPNKRNKPRDRWTTDSHALARAGFEKLLHACIREMILNDTPPAQALPAGWKATEPVRSVEWPPRRGGQP